MNSKKIFTVFSSTNDSNDKIVKSDDFLRQTKIPRHVQTQNSFSKTKKKKLKYILRMAKLPSRRQCNLK